MLNLYAADRIEPLARHLAEVYAVPPDDPLAPEWLAIPSAGMERWLSLELARHLGATTPHTTDGVAANIEFHFPDSLRQCVLQAGRDPMAPDPWQVERLTWTVLRNAQDRPGDLPRGLVDPRPGASRFGAARRIADLFDRYHVHRPEMIRSWAKGQLVDGTGRDLSPHHHWQPMLWRLCRQSIGEPSPPERFPELIEALRRGMLDVDLPRRLVLFGLTLLPGGAPFLDLTAAVATVRDVHVFLLEPSAAVRGRLVALSARPPPSARLRAEDRSAELIRHPLLRSWGRLHRETVALLTDASRRGLSPPVLVTRAGGGAGGGTGGGDASGDIHSAGGTTGAGNEGPGSPGPSLLAQLQADIRSDQAPNGSFRPDPTDRSVQLHACYGPTRQVEVARDVILHLLADPELDLSEDDIVVLTPSLDRFAPLIAGVFGSSGGSDPGDGDLDREEPVPGGPTGAEHAGEPPAAEQAPALRYQIADRSIRTTNPVLEAMTDLVALIGSRFDSSSVLDFMTSEPVRRRFGLSADDLARVHTWVHATEIRWGLDTHHRRTFGVPAGVDTNTWLAGLDRLVVGTAVHGELHLAVGDVAPYETDGDDAALAGRLAELIDVLARLQRETDGKRPVEEWMALLRTTIPDLFETAPDLHWQLDALVQVFGAVVESATTGGVASSTPLSFADVRRILDVELRAKPGRPNFFRGGITVTSMTPLRGVPFRVVCLLGVDHEALTAGVAEGDGDDVGANAPLLGDRDPRGDVRLALLEAVLAAGERLVVLRDGHDVLTNHEVPAPVVVDELTDTLGAMVDPALRPTFLATVETAHPRLAHDERCFEPGAFVDGAWSFDPGALRGALARRNREAVGPPIFLPTCLAPPASGEISLDELHQFFHDPIRFFLERRLELRLPRDDGLPEPVVPLKLGGLTGYSAGTRLLGFLLEGRSPEEWEQVEVRLGTVPPGVLASGELEKVRATAEAILQAALSRGLCPERQVPVPVDVALPDGTQITGTVIDRLRSPASGPCDMGFARAKPVDQVTAWLDLMALVATDPGKTWRSVIVRRAATGAGPPAVVDLSPVAGHDARRRAETARKALGVAVDLYRRGLVEPVPLFPRFSHAVLTGKDLRNAWRPFKGYGDGDGSASELVFGTRTFEEMLSIEPREGDPEGSGNRVERFARYLWDTIERSTTPSPEPAADTDTDGSDADGDGSDDRAGSGRRDRGGGGTSGSTSGSVGT